jgi:hypothetical protein
MDGIKEAQANSAPSIGNSPNPIPTLDGLNSEIEELKGTSEITKHSKRKLETPRKLAKKEALDSPDSGKVKQDLPNSIPLASWADKVIKAEALVVQAKVVESLVQEKKEDPIQVIPEIIDTSMEIGWIEVGKKKKTHALSQPMVTRSQACKPSKKMSTSPTK